MMSISRKRHLYVLMPVTLGLTVTAIYLHSQSYGITRDYKNYPTQLSNNFVFNNTTRHTMSTKHPNFTMHWNHAAENTTIVTAYFDLGTFRKGYSQVFTTTTYVKWSVTFKYLVNPLVIFTDSKTFAASVKDHRKHLANKTVIILIKRNHLWPFKLQSKIKKVFSQPNYPKHHPNTVVPAYSCAQHSKYAVVAEAVKRRYFDTEFYAWLDIGYFRYLSNSTQYFTVNAPWDLDKSKLAMNKVFSRVMNTSYKNIFRRNTVWVGGGMFIGTGNVILRFERDYRKAVLFFLKKKLMNTDQQVIYSMYSDEGRSALKPNISLQLYVPKGVGDPWFYLGYRCREEVKMFKP